MTLKYRTLIDDHGSWDGTGSRLGAGDPADQGAGRESAGQEKLEEHQDEYDLYGEFGKAQGQRARSTALDKWKQAFPDSDFAFDREEAYLGDVSGAEHDPAVLR